MEGIMTKLLGLWEFSLADFRLQEPLEILKQSNLDQRLSFAIQKSPVLKLKIMTLSLLQLMVFGTKFKIKRPFKSSKKLTNLVSKRNNGTASHLKLFYWSPWWEDRLITFRSLLSDWTTQHWSESQRKETSTSRSCQISQIQRQKRKTHKVTRKITFQKRSEKSTAESMKLTKLPAKFSNNPEDPEFKLINSNDSHFLFLTLIYAFNFYRW